MDVTDDLCRSRSGDERAVERLLPAVYDELKRLASGYLKDERQGHTLQPTALVHEAYLRLVDQTRADFHDRDHFVAIAATAMRRVLVDHARARAAARRTPSSPGAAGIAGDVAAGDSPGTLDAGDDFVAIDLALDRLAARSPRQARVVELRYFAGLTIEATARALSVSDKTVKDDWKVASAFLRREWARLGHS